jgi:hypothetical protein
MSADLPWFTHRMNEDRTFDSICMRCYRTVDTQSREVALAAKEQVHLCEKDDVLPHDPFDSDSRS